MTDKKIEKIKAEIERRYKTLLVGAHGAFRNGKIEALREVRDFINSLQKEPECEDLELASERILRRAMEVYGRHAQINMALEEMGELIVALQHWLRGRVSYVEVCEEVADVQIMMEQLAMIFGKDIVRNYYESKIKRLEQRLNKED